MHIVLINIAVIFVMILLGYFSRRGRLLDANTTLCIAKLVTNCFYPVLIFSSITGGFTLNSLLSHWTLPAGTLLIMGLGMVVGLITARFSRFETAAQKHAFVFQSTMNNYSFLPLPLALLFWGERGVAALAFSTVGSELAVWTFGVLALTGEKPRLSSLRRLLNIPMAAIIAAGLFLLLQHLFEGTAVAAWFTSDTGIELKDAVWSAMSMFGKSAIPLAMIVAGSRMAELHPSRIFTKPLLLLSFLRLIVIPALAVTAIFLLPFTEDVRLVLILVAVMPCAVSSVMLSDIYKADSEFASACVLLTHIFCLPTIPLWLAIIPGF